MDDEERKDGQEDQGILNRMKSTFSKANKSKFVMAIKKALIAASPYMLPAILLFLGMIFIWAAITHIFDLEGSSNVHDVASSKLIKEDIEIAEAPGNQGYYFKINQKIIDDFLVELNKSYHNGDYFDTNVKELEDDEDNDEGSTNDNDDQNDDEDDEFVYDEDDADITKDDVANWFLTDDYEKYLVKMIRAQVASSYPRLGDYTGEDSKEDAVGNKKDKEGNYAAQGVVQIKRTIMDIDGKTEDEINLNYLPHDKFLELITANDKTALKYFSFDESTGVIYYATYREVVTTFNGKETDRIYVLTENSMSYKSVTNLCDMPYNFLFNLLQESGNPEWVMSVADLLIQDTDLVVMIQDQINISELTHVETFDRVERIKKRRYRKSGTPPNTRWRRTSSSTDYKFPAGKQEIETTITTTYTNTATVFIKEAKTWCLDFEQEVVAKNELPDGTIIGGSDNNQNNNITTTNKDMPKDASSYGLKSDSITYNVEGITKAYNIAWVSDLHTVANHEGNWGNINSDQKEWIQGRYNMFTSDVDGTHSEAIWDRVTKYLNEGGFDAVIFGGDTLDYYSNDNYEILTEHLSKLNIPYVFIYGAEDHDADKSRSSDAQNALNNMRDEANTSLDLDEIKIVGILNSADRNGTEVGEAGKLIEDSDKPVLVASHVPFDGAEDNSNLESWCKGIHNNQKYYWTRSNSSWIIQNNSTMDNFLNKYIYNTNSKVFGVLAGHVHMGSWEGNLTSKVKEHIFPAAYRGYVGTIRIEPVDNTNENESEQTPDTPSTNENTNANPEYDSIVYEEYDEDKYKSLEYTVVSTSTRSSGSNSKTETEKSISDDRLLYFTTEKMRTTKYGWDVVTKTEKKINYERFLGLWKNDTGKYYLGCKYNENGKTVGYSTPEGTGIRYPVDDISEENGQNINELIELLASHDNTQTHELLMMYYWNVYTGENVYDVNIQELLNLFNTDTMIYMSSSSPSNLLKEYIRALENSGGAPTNADGTKYIIQDDGAGNAVVGYGIDIVNGGFKPLFEQMGYPTKVGGEVDIEFVDGLEDQEIESKLSTIKAATSGLNLKEYQLHALVSRAYNCGDGSLSSSGDRAGAIGIRNGKNFIQAYSAYWNESKDNMYAQKVTSGDFSNKLYTNYMSKPTTSGGKHMAGLENRRKSEWTLFQTGYYDKLGKWYQEGGGRIISIADEIHKYMEDNHYTYCVHGRNRYEECTGSNKHGLNSTFEASKTGYHHTCCATYVSWVLQEAGYMSDSEHIDGANNLRNFLMNSKGWQIITSANELQPGDVVCYNSHVEIYAGDGKVYNAGSGEHIRGSSPHSKNVSSMICGLRAPN